ncbi:KdsC family phosphatase [Desulfolutivibrio sulfoxidireducens]|uniref:KdsC family phosphatase n=1 Tax=Desulfolutivibrio sulfoxidireducens TaxID=2773299 RepID=UPI00159D8706|nr:phenylphosphate carboxylase subunit delta [Desulfolutivibrio sulfoxidireducens]QLA16235.1 phenylphosphate carboxylase subunit delta [Desulfolutivibrio sulfoxidireducens]QLA19866.1 phenylphosphate carboxylase subunit delta [Desulfolutivibrio sulfoxidireducens]
MDVMHRARRVELLILDVDGVMTDGGLYYDPSGNIHKRFYVQDGLGIKLAQEAGLEVAMVSGLDQGAAAARAKELGIVEYHGGHLRKLPLVTGMLSRKGLCLEQAAFLGDDWVDAPVMRRVGLPMAVADAQPEILDMALWVSRRPGGRGAVREAIRFLLQAQGRLQAMWEKWDG